MTKRLVWVSNTLKNPRYVIPQFGESIEEAIADHIQWVSQFVKGDPQATQLCSVDELKQLGCIGLYKEVEEE